ncbi:DEAD/DEAH box helicase [Actinomadura craniellae]|uniref:DEAD/DEAH box helicase n=1 Tax=Actinomadura craniellae TaxID=2231787 RepID=UPI001314E158|nr:DEAD/DEAH box helicase [Actinomadura craniellae]
MAFQKRRVIEAAAGTAEELYPLLQHGDGAPRELWVRQAEVLRAYHESFTKVPDVAIELPTGAGKTLVGSLIAEWRRRTFGDRVAYLAPTRQLARQAADRAASYGVPTSLLTGSHKLWDSTAETRFIQGKSVAFVTYSAIFNSDPKLNPTMLVLDDAHAAEGFVAANWSVVIRRSELAYDHLLEALHGCGALAGSVTARLREGEEDAARTVYLAGLPQVAAAATDIERVLSEAQAHQWMSRNANFAFSQIQGSLPACLVFVSASQILIRPFIAPTAFHPAFETAEQRLYLSATVGDGGELLRGFGRKKIEHIAAPAASTTQGTGRRFFVFPRLVDDLQTEDAETAFVSDAISSYGKAVLLAPDGRTRDHAVEVLVPGKMEKWTAEEFEDAPDGFEGAKAGVLALANRYDGIDLPGDSCRMIVLVGLPSGAHLQERFLHESVGAVVALRERIRTRLTQGAGRATRNSSDFAAVIVLSRELVNFCADPAVQAAMHPELRAEVAFGLTYSTDITAAETRENLEYFRRQDPEWQEADSEIRVDRDATTRTSLPGTAQLSASARHEVEALNAAWGGEWERAVEFTGKALERLAGGKEIRRYQALWNYLAGSWAVLAARTGHGNHWIEVAQQHYTAARAAAAGTRWLTDLLTDAAQMISPTTVLTLSSGDALDALVVEQIVVSPLRTGPAKPFITLAQDIRTGLGQTDASPFERALDSLGRLAGSTSCRTRTKADAEPDSVWLFSDLFWVACEAKSDTNPAKEVPASDATQACGHLNFTASEQGIAAAPSGSITLLVTPQQRVDIAAARVADAGLYLVSLDQIRDLAERLITCWGAIRTQTKGTGPDKAALEIERLLRTHRTLPSQWIPALTTRRVADG